MALEQRGPDSKKRKNVISVMLPRTFLFVNDKFPDHSTTDLLLFHPTEAEVISIYVDSAERFIT